MSDPLPLPAIPESVFLVELGDRQLADHLASVTRERHQWLTWKPFNQIRGLWPQLPAMKAPVRIEAGCVHIGEPLAADDPAGNLIRRAAQAIRPWKKGPFHLFGTDIDAEWRSDWKWDRLVAALPNMAGSHLLDVGCHNGYYMFRMLAHQPAHVLGIDPVPRLWYQFHLLQHFAKTDALEFQMWGWQELEGWTSLFDGVFCMGILYHHADPIGLLRHLYQALKPGGFLVLESIVIPGDTPTCLVPSDRYAMMRNVWFLPTVVAMENMLVRTGFEGITCVADEVHTPGEQRTTAWNPGPSHADFMLPGDPGKTVEGYPAPRRAVLIARKPCGKGR